MTWCEGVLLAITGVASGVANSAAGGGSLLTFPVLVAVGLSTVAANVTTTLALWPGYLSGAATYRAELVDQRGRVLGLAPYAVGGALAGTVLLLLAPSEAFDAVVPYLVLLAVGLVALQPRLSGWVQARRDAVRSDRADHARGPLRAVVLAAAVYGGYFGGGLGVILVAVLGTFLAASAQDVNALKNAMSVVVNTAALVAFAVLGPVDWAAVAVVGPASLVGGAGGTWVAKRLPAHVLRRAVIVFGLGAGVRLLLR